MTFGGRDYTASPAYLQRFVWVDNLAPSASFANAEDPDDPELIRATVADAHSGHRLLRRRVPGARIDGP